MNRNEIKIVSNHSIRKIAYYFRNENDEWVRVPNSSALSRKEFSEALIKEKIYDIIKVIDEVYNPGNRGIDIFFEGTDEEYAIVYSAIEEVCLDADINCNKKRSKIAVAGKIGSGKTTVIEAVGRYLESEYSRQKGNKYEVFIDNKSNTKWYELKGIDLGKEYIAQSKLDLNELAENGMSIFVYCLSTCKIEKLEKELILDFSEKHPEIKVLIVLTLCVDDDAALLAEQISNQLKQKRVIPVLAKELKTRNGSIPAYGIDQIVQYICGGK